MLMLYILVYWVFNISLKYQKQAKRLFASFSLTLPKKMVPCVLAVRRVEVRDHWILSGKIANMFKFTTQKYALMNIYGAPEVTWKKKIWKKKKTYILLRDLTKTFKRSCRNFLFSFFLRFMDHTGLHFARRRQQCSSANEEVLRQRLSFCDLQLIIFSSLYHVLLIGRISQNFLFWYTVTIGAPKWKCNDGFIFLLF